ncbi:MAG: GTPase HflX [Crocinitomicaceae bacterium TMED45]|nr:MAG: GTPase HflX [Crocinitomicaceae bacterium TMED45]|tara:strand:+ start:5465 stop:6646 length:1182 start_codon:yes stop_codon:yes gene_type:complete
MAKKREPLSTAKPAETCVLIGLATRHQRREQLEEYLEELAFLAETAKAQRQRTFIQSLDKPDVRTFVGSGKLQEIKEYVEEEDIDIIIFDDELSPIQLRNIEKEIPERKVLDRTNLILDIFAQRAATAHAKTQVELAQYQYLLPRLTNMWTHLQKQKGGIGMKGPGEKEIETDRRVIRDRIALLRKQLASIDKQMATQRKNRGQMIRVALVGYTNVGKSTLMTLMSKSDVFAENKLFATLDTTVRKVVIDNLPFLLSDTVGFIRKLPTQLIESFKSTLDETRESDMLLHVIDVSHPQFEDHMAVVERTLADIGSDSKPTMVLFNKIDLLTNPDGERTPEDLERGIRERFEALGYDVMFLSAKTKVGYDAFRSTLYERVKELHIKRYPYNQFLY